MNECVRCPEILHEIVNGYWMRKIWTFDFAAVYALGAVRVISTDQVDAIAAE